MRSRLIVLLALFSVCTTANGLKTGHWNGRQVIYEEKDGWAVAEGDILLGRAGEIPSEGPKSSTKSQQRDAIGRASLRSRWPDGVIPYTISNELPNQERIMDALGHWSQNTPIRLVPRTDEVDYIRFTRPSSPGTCNSFVGMIGREQAINIGDDCDRGAVIHEIGHAVGLFHEQSRQDRDLYLKMKLENSDKRAVVNFAQQLSDADDIGIYDHSSIMHYEIYSFSRNGLPVFETIPLGIPVHQRSRLSPNDLVAVRRLYNWPAEETTISTNPLGLEIVVDGETYVSPKSFRWEAGSRHNVRANPRYDQDFRYSFHAWTDGGAIEHEITASPDLPIFTANFIRSGRVTVGPGVTADPPSEDGYYPEGSVVELRPNSESASFQDWTGVIYTAFGRSQNPLRLGIYAPEVVYVARFTRSPLTTITSDPPGLQVFVDGAETVTPRSFAWTPGSLHEVKVSATTQLGGLETARYRFRGWSDDGEPTHMVEAAADQSKSVVARFQRQYLVARGPAAGGLTEFSPTSPDGYYDAGTQLQVVPSPVTSFRFLEWTGDLKGSDSPGQITVEDHLVIGATFQIPQVITSVVNSATLVNTGAVAPEELVTINGLEIGDSNGDTSAIRVTFDELPARVVFASRDAIRVVAPRGIASRLQTTVRVSNAAGSTSRTVLVIPAAPGVLTFDDSGHGNAKAWNADGSENNPDHPAEKGSRVLLLVTGASSATPIEARIGGRVATVESVEADSPGLVRMTLRVPDQIPSGSVPVVVRASEASSVSNVFLSIH